ncbi:unnamed protein product [Dovyalis caffra]|uniref:Uncharacterized protein n=1 Tax=Dovyalis caffra TaxID=77055 RepID=A0AAV1SPJ4_9ROSI|nr:unnamed protein product [Dovyalis caffra]
MALNEKERKSNNYVVSNKMVKEHLAPINVALNEKVGKSTKHVVSNKKVKLPYIIHSNPAYKIQQTLQPKSQTR